MNYLSLFSGVGGGDLAFQHLLDGFRCVGYVEYEEYCQKVLRQRIKDGLLDAAPIFGDIRQFISEGYAESYKGMVDLITAGFPCQPFSVAGKQLAEKDNRNLWPETNETIRIIGSDAVFLENVPGLLSKEYAITIFNDLTEIGYKALPPLILGADDIGANHRRKRIWILAYSNGTGQKRTFGDLSIDKNTSFRNDPCNGSQNLAYSEQRRLQKRPMDRGNLSYSDRARQNSTIDISEIEIPGKDVADTEGNTIRTGLCEDESSRFRWRRSGNRGCEISDTPKHGLEGKESKSEFSGRESGLFAKCSWWESEPSLGRVAHGVANRVDRLKAIGNGIVPQVAATAWEILT